MKNSILQKRSDSLRVQSMAGLKVTIHWLLLLPQISRLLFKLHPLKSKHGAEKGQNGPLRIFGHIWMFKSGVCTSFWFLALLVMWSCGVSRDESLQCTSLFCVFLNVGLPSQKCMDRKPSPPSQTRLCRLDRGRKCPTSTSSESTGCTSAVSTEILKDAVYLLK